MPLVGRAADLHHAFLDVDIAGANAAEVVLSARAGSLVRLLLAFGVVADHAARIAAYRLGNIGHLLDIRRQIYIVFIFASRPVLHRDVLREMLILHKLVSDVEAAVAAGSLVHHMRTLYHLFAALSIYGLLVLLVLSVQWP